MAELETTVTEIGTDVGTEGKDTDIGIQAPETSESAELAKLKADFAKQKAALDKATSEAASMKKQLRAKQSAEEIAAEEAKALQESMEEELKQLRKEKAVGLTTAKLMPIVGGDATLAGEIAEYLYGAEDSDAALAALGKAWAAREKALKLEYGKIPAPGVGNSDGPTFTKQQLDGLTYMERVKFATEHPDEYNKLMGR